MELQKRTARKIIVFNPTTTPPSKYEFETDSNKWSDIAEQLKPLVQEKGQDLAKFDAIVKSNSTTLKLPDAVIPEGDQIIFLQVAKQASGGVKADFDSMKYTELRRSAKGLPGYETLGSNPTREELLKVLKNNPSFKEAKPKKKAEVVKEYKEKAKTTEPNLEERVSALEAIVLNTDKALSSILYGFKKASEEVEKNPIKRASASKAAPTKVTTPVLTEEDTSVDSLMKQFKELTSK